MAVTAPRVGSSAFAETGFREMSKARTALRLVARPGKLSEMVGRNVFDFQLVVGSVDFYQATLVGYINGVSNTPNTGSIKNGSWPGYTLTGLYASDRGDASGWLSMNNAPNRTWYTTIAGTRFQWNYSSGTYKCTTDIRGFLQRRVGQTLDVVVE